MRQTIGDLQQLQTTVNKITLNDKNPVKAFFRLDNNRKNIKYRGNSGGSSVGGNIINVNGGPVFDIMIIRKIAAVIGFQAFLTIPLPFPAPPITPFIPETEYSPPVPLSVISVPKTLLRQSLLIFSSSLRMSERLDINSFIDKFIIRLRRQKARDLIKGKQVRYFKKELREENVPLNSISNLPSGWYSDRGIEKKTVKLAR